MSMLINNTVHTGVSNRGDIFDYMLVDVGAMKIIFQLSGDDARFRGSCFLHG